MLASAKLEHLSFIKSVLTQEGLAVCRMGP
jgi:hypothetical protein